MVPHDFKSDLPLIKECCEMVFEKEFLLFASFQINGVEISKRFILECAQEIRMQKCLHTQIRN